MKQSSRFDLWMDRSIAQLMRITNEMDSTDSGEPASELSGMPIFQPLPPHAEASDYLSINEWMESREDIAQ